MTCEQCYNLKDMKCSINKDNIVGPISDGEKLLPHKVPCIFKNTEHKDISLDILEKLALTRVSVEGYTVANSKDDIDSFLLLLDKEKEYIKDKTDSPLAKIIVFLSKPFLSIQEISDYSHKLAEKSNGKLWSICIKMNESDSMKETCLEALKLPFSLELSESDDFKTLIDFKSYVMCNPVPIMFGNIFNNNVLKETYYANKEKSILQHNSQK